MPPNLSELNTEADNLLASVDSEQQGLGGQYISYPVAVQAIAFPGELKRAVDVYHGPYGNGYAIRFIYRVNGETWGRIVTRGPESARTVDWSQIQYP